MTDHSLSENGKKRTLTHISKIARGLRRMADDVERETGRRIGEDGTGLDRAVVNVIHTVTWGVSNLNLSGLVSSHHDFLEVRALEDAKDREVVYADTHTETEKKEES